ncbi:hypothetical protein CROQUDRAFT_717863 [Cronartium quercuum f. sp. fusiforme G11]|uniref:Uncharacterized protein n=1 Tax=Cronartium quercuum f. sp. fusiforme G11 TaxID=708437 RepID=A0A9P6N9F9_9BASI|nr:hypothetical protein CROQUDRAFT_717863 [Cronartium quercuum f. sp. fusiforme G11]
MRMMKFGFVTNISQNEKNEKEVPELMMNEEDDDDDDKMNRKKLSRGKLVKDFLMGFQNVKTYIKSSSELDKQMDGFNLIVGSLKEEANEIVFGFHSNQSEVKSLDGWNEFENGMSNGIIKDHKSEWEKVRIGKTMLGDLLKERYCKMNDDDQDDDDVDDRLINDLFKILRAEAIADLFIVYSINQIG